MYQEKTGITSLCRGQIVEAQFIEEEVTSTPLKCFLDAASHKKRAAGMTVRRRQRINQRPSRDTQHTLTSFQGSLIQTLAHAFFTLK